MSQMDQRKGTCPDCGALRLLTRDGMLRYHFSNEFAYGSRQVCGGMGKPPTTIVEGVLARLRVKYSNVETLTNMLISLSQHCAPELQKLIVDLAMDHHNLKTYIRTQGQGR